MNKNTYSARTGRGDGATGGQGQEVNRVWTHEGLSAYKK